MGKRKPDPPTQKVVLPEVDSGLLHIFKWNAAAHFEIMPWDFEKLPAKEQRQKMKDYFQVLVKKDAIDNSSQQDFKQSLVLYKREQEVIRKRWEKSLQKKNFE